MLLVLLGSLFSMIVPLAYPADSSSTAAPWPMFQHDMEHTGLSVYLGPSTPIELWNFTWQPEGGRQGYVDSSPSIGSDGTVYVGGSCANAYTCGLYAINPDGTERWNFTGGGVESSPAIGNDGTVYVGSDNGYLYAISPDGSEKWSFYAGPVVTSSPTIGPDGTVYIGGSYNLFAINPAGTQS